VPAYFNDTMRAATRYAAEIAGVQVLGLLSEPTAAAIAFGYDNRPKNCRDRGRPRRWTFDVTVLEFDHQDLIVKGTGGDAYLGGATSTRSSRSLRGAVRQAARHRRARSDALTVEDFTQVSQTGCCAPTARSMISALVSEPSCSCKRPGFRRDSK